MKINIENIGPFEKLDKKVDAKTSIAIYARNGSGKTFISRCFRLFSIEQNERDNYIERLVKNGSKKSNFEYEYSYDGAIKKISFSIDNNKITDFVDNKDSLFYVFNSDYIEDNLRAKNYQPDGSVDGVILGKNNVDLSDEKEKLEIAKQEFETKKAILEKKIFDIKDEIKKAGVKVTMNAYKDICLDNVIKTNNNVEDGYKVALEKCNKLSDIPDDEKHILDVNSDLNIDFIEEVNIFLAKKYSLSTFEEEFTNKIKSKLEFVEKGVELMQGSEKCPFCGQDINGDSKELIHQYSLFINDEQNKAIKTAKSYISIIKAKKTEINIFLTNLLRGKTDIDRISKYISDIRTINQKEIDDNFNDLINQLSLYEECLNNKISDISKDCFKSELNISDCYNNIINIYSQLSSTIKECNTKLDNINSLKTDARKELCKEALNNITFKNNSEIQELKRINNEIISLGNSVKEKELTNSMGKKEIIAKKLSEYVERIFGNKYKFDEDKFEIKLGEFLIGKNARFVLSDGEKSAFAFIHYLANVHSIVETTDDYKKIVFIIDDPVSSMDYQYLYMVLSNIKLITKELDVENFRSILLTHNLEFFSSLIRNRIYGYPMIINNSKLEEFSRNLIMPYEYHLVDIKNAVIEKKIVHTIPNSIRHIIETICQFEGRAKDSEGILTFIQENEEFNKKEYVYNFMQDLSHGNLRYEQSYTEDQVLDACYALIKMIERKYPYQLKD